MNIKFKEWDCTIVADYYKSNRRKAIQLIDTITSEPIATATVNIPNEPINPDEVFIKDYSENEGMAKTLIDTGIINKQILVSCRSGFVLIHKYRLTDKGLALFS